jgi:hypothetical protein
VPQAPGPSALNAEALRGQLAEAKPQAQTAVAETATAQRLLDSGRAAAAGREWQLEADQRRLEAAWAAAADQCASAEAARRRAEADAEASHWKVRSCPAQVRGL